MIRYGNLVANMFSTPLAPAMTQSPREPPTTVEQKQCHHIREGIQGLQIVCPMSETRGTSRDPTPSFTDTGSGAGEQPGSSFQEQWLRSAATRNEAPNSMAGSSNHAASPDLEDPVLQTVALGTKLPRRVEFTPRLPPGLGGQGLGAEPCAKANAPLGARARV